MENSNSLKNQKDKGTDAHQSSSHGEKSLILLVTNKESRNGKSSFGIKILVSLTIALLATLSIPWLINKGYDMWGIGNRLFVLDNPILQFIPYTIVLLFFGVLTYGLFNLIISEIRKIKLRNLIRLHEREPDSFKQRINNEPGLVTFILKVLEKVDKSKKDLNEKTDYFKNIIDAEYNRNLSSYSIPRLLIWTMPIIGFIGTVLGISIAVGDFSGFLSALDGAEDLDLIKQGLSGISGGLSYAFDTTLLGLASSLVTMVTISLAENRDNKFYNLIEDSGVRYLSETDSLKDHLEYESEDPIFKVFSQFTEKLDESLKAFTSSLTKASNTLTSHSGIVANNSVILTNNQSLLKSRLSDFDDSLAKNTEKLQESLGNFSSLILNLDKSLEDVLSKADKYLEKIDKVNINEPILQNLSELQNNNMALIRSMEKFSDDNLDSNKMLIDQLNSLRVSQEKVAELLKNLDSGFEVRLVSSK
jgi:biopolymer transport protein ExbB/TolQ